MGKNGEKVWFFGPFVLVSRLGVLAHLFWVVRLPIRDAGAPTLALIGKICASLRALRDCCVLTAFAHVLETPSFLFLRVNLSATLSFFALFVTFLCSCCRVFVACLLDVFLCCALLLLKSYWHSPTFLFVLLHHCFMWNLLILTVHFFPFKIVFVQHYFYLYHWRCIFTGFTHTHFHNYLSINHCGDWLSFLYVPFKQCLRSLHFFLCMLCDFVFMILAYSHFYVMKGLFMYIVNCILCASYVDINN